MSLICWSEFDLLVDTAFGVEQFGMYNARYFGGQEPRITHVGGKPKGFAGFVHGLVSVYVETVFGTLFVVFFVIFYDKRQTVNGILEINDKPFVSPSFLY